MVAKKTNTKTTGKNAAKNRANKAKAAEAKLKGAQVQTFKQLATTAKTINVKLDKADKLASDAFDHRLSACLLLGEAKADCEKAKINFKKWCEDNVSKSYHTVRRLASIGYGNTETQARLLLADLRERTAEQAKTSRDKSKAKASVPASKDRSAVTTVKVDPYMQALAIVTAMDDKAKLNFVHEIAAQIGMVVAPKGEASLIGRNGHNVATMKANLNKLSALDRLAVIEAGAQRAGIEIVLPKTGKVKGDDDDLLAIPDFLKRSPTVKAPAKRKPAKRKTA